MHYLQMSIDGRAPFLTYSRHYTYESASLELAAIQKNPKRLAGCFFKISEFQDE